MVSPLSTGILNKIINEKTIKQLNKSRQVDGMLEVEWDTQIDETKENEFVDDLDDPVNGEHNDDDDGGK